MARLQYYDPNGAKQQALINRDFASFNFDTIDGVTYEFDLTQPAKYDENGKLLNKTARRVVDLKFDGKAIDDSAKFLVASNNYRAFGGGNFPGLSAEKVVINAPEENRQAVVNYLAAQTIFNPSADGNWHIRAVPGVSMTFLSASIAAKYLSNHVNIEKISDNGDGSSLYQLRN